MRIMFMRALVCAAVSSVTISAAAAASYQVVELPAHPVIDGARNEALALQLDARGRSLIYVTAYGTDGEKTRGQLCDAGARRCAVIAPRFENSVWNGASSDHRFMAGTRFGDSQGTEQWAMRRRAGQAVERLVEGGDGVAVNRHGAMVGNSFPYQAWLYDTALHLLPALPGGTSTRVAAINDAGLAVGWSDSTDGTHAVGWKDGKVFTLETVGTYSWADSVTSTGVAYGAAISSTRPYRMHAARFENGKVFDLGVIPNPDYANESTAYAANRAGIAVGVGTPEAEYGNVAVIFDGKGSATELKKLLPKESQDAYELHSAHDINDAGQILVWASRLKDGLGVVLRLDPVPQAGRP